MEVSTPVTHPRRQHVHERYSGHDWQQTSTTCLPTTVRCRSLRLVMFTFFCVSATVGAVIATTQVFGALRGAEDAFPLNDVATVSLQASVLSELQAPAHRHARRHLPLTSTSMQLATVWWGRASDGLGSCCSRWRWTWGPSRRSPSCCGET